MGSNPRASPLEHVRRVTDDESYRNGMIEHNYELAKRSLATQWLRRRLRELLDSVTGVEDSR